MGCEVRDVESKNFFQYFYQKVQAQPELIEKSEVLIFVLSVWDSFNCDETDFLNQTFECVGLFEALKPNALCSSSLLLFGFKVSEVEQIVRNGLTAEKIYFETYKEKMDERKRKTYERGLSQLEFAKNKLLEFKRVVQDLYASAQDLYITNEAHRRTSQVVDPILEAARASFANDVKEAYRILNE